MKYRESQKDKSLRTWFENDNSRALLRRIFLKSGSVRGINNLDIKFDYPITAIAGKNGAGKSTILALACCAFHNDDHGFKPHGKIRNYYTYSDFFIQHSSEVPPQGIAISYGIAYDNWRGAAPGVHYQARTKKSGGKWNDYAERVHRNVVFIGIERIVPHSEKSPSKSYSKSFRESAKRGWEDDVKEIVGYILGKSYDSFSYVEHSKYRLPLVNSGGAHYSGFNMGAGENALFEIFSTIFSCGNGGLIVIDEIELGLHAEAQRKFIEKLKDICLEKKCQIICTTHSKEIFDCFPGEARFFIESINGKTRITDSISSDFAFSKLNSSNSEELILFIEDEVAKALISTMLPTKIRTRIKMCVIGSATALSKQLAAAYARQEAKPVLAIFDGDQRKNEMDNIAHAKKMAETSDNNIKDWFKERALYLPGDTWPEAWIVQKGKEALSSLAIDVDTEEDSLADYLEYGLQAGKHNEFHEIAKNLGLDDEHCLRLLCSHIKRNFPEEFSDLLLSIEKTLNNP